MSLGPVGYEEFRIIHVDSNVELQIFPQGEFIEDLQVNKSLSRSINGSLHTFKVANSNSFNYSFPLSFVNSSDRFVINDFWENQTEFNLQLRNSTNIFETYGRIVNQIQPLNKKTDQQNNLFEGVINFKSSTNIRDTLPISIGPFILDDNIFGILDGFNGVL